MSHAEILVKYFAFSILYSVAIDIMFIVYLQENILKQMGKGKDPRNYAFLFVRGDFGLFLEMRGRD